MKAIRSFIAIDLPESIQSKLGEITRQLNSPHLEAVRWVAPQNIHLTLKFLGDISPNNKQVLCQILETQSSQVEPFEIEIGELGAFPNPRRPRVIWIGVKSPPSLEILQRGIETDTVRLGYPSEERRFSPHLTLGRVSHNAGPKEVLDVSDRLAGCKVGTLGKMIVDRICLFRSDLQPGGAVYSLIYKSPLKS